MLAKKNYFLNILTLLCFQESMFYFLDPNFLIIYTNIIVIIIVITIVNFKDPFFSNGHCSKKIQLFLMHLNMTILNGPRFFYLNCFYSRHNQVRFTTIIIIWTLFFQKTSFTLFVFTETGTHIFAIEQRC